MVFCGERIIIIEEVYKKRWWEDGMLVRIIISNECWCRGGDWCWLGLLSCLWISGKCYKRYVFFVIWVSENSSCGIVFWSGRSGFFSVWVIILFFGLLFVRKVFVIVMVIRCSVGLVWYVVISRILLFFEDGCIVCDVLGFVGKNSLKSLFVRFFWEF